MDGNIIYIFSITVLTNILILIKPIQIIKIGQLVIEHFDFRTFRIVLYAISEHMLREALFTLNITIDLSKQVDLYGQTKRET